MNNLFYSILIDTAPANAAGYPKFISKNSAALKPNVIANNYFYNIEEREERSAYSWWTVNCTREEGLAGGGAVLPADPCKDAANGDYTLVNAVAMNSNIGDPRWNPMRGKNPTSEITVETVTDLLTAISAGKGAITLKAGTYDLTTVADVAEVSNGVLAVTGSLNLVGEEGAVLVGGFKISGDAVKTFTLRGLELTGAGAVQNMIEIGSKDVAMTSVVLRDNVISDYNNRLVYMSQEGAVISSYDMTGNYVHDMGTSGDFIDIRKGTQIKDGDEVIGNQTKVKVVKNKVAPPFRKAEFDIMFGEGISKTGEIVDLGVDFGIVKKSGSWFSYGETKLAQGRDATKQLLADNPELAEELEAKIFEAMKNKE